MQAAFRTGSCGSRDRALPSRWALGRCRQWGRLVGPASPSNRKEWRLLTACLEQQAAQIQKVSAQLEASKPAPQVVNNP